MDLVNRHLPLFSCPFLLAHGHSAQGFSWARAHGAFAYLANVFLLVITAQVAILELLTNVGQLLVDALLLEFPSSSVSQIGNELDQAAHVGVAAGRAAQEAGSC